MTLKYVIGAQEVIMCIQQNMLEWIKQYEMTREIFIPTK
jgi:hypothetical protein